MLFQTAMAFLIIYEEAFENRSFINVQLCQIKYMYIKEKIE